QQLGRISLRLTGRRERAIVPPLLDLSWSRAMRKRRWVLWTTVGVAAAVVAGTTLLMLVYHTPSFYERAHVPPSDERKGVAAKFFVDLIDLGERFVDDGKYHKRGLQG